MTRLYFLIGVFIVAIVLSLYFAREAFTGSTTGSGSNQIVAPTLRITATTKVSDVIAYGNALLNVANNIKARLVANPTRVPVLTTQDITTLGNQYLGENPSTATFSTILISIERNIETLNSGKTTAANLIREGKITNNDTLRTGMPKLFPDTRNNINEVVQAQISTGNELISRITSQINVLNRITQPLPSNPPPAGGSTGQIAAPTARLTTTTTVSDVITYLNDILNIGNIIKARLTANPTRVPTLTPEDIITLGSEYLGNNPSNATFSRILISVEKSIEETRSSIQIVTDTVREGTLMYNDTLLTGIPKLFPEQATNVNETAQYFINEVNPAVEKSSLEINTLIRITQQPNPPPNPPPGTVNPNPGGANAEAGLDSSGNYLDGSGNIVRVNLNDLLGAISSPSFTDKKKNEKDDKIRIPTPVKPVETPCLDQYYSILKPQIQKDISTAIHDEFARVTAPPNSTPITTPATQQGCSMQETQQQQQQCPDMSRYIRKDSVPCWNCSDL